MACGGCCCCCCSGPGCSLRITLVVLQVLTACAIIGLSVFTILYVPAIEMLDNPVWAGGSLLLAGLFSIVFCCPKSERRRKKREGRGEAEFEDGDEDSACVFAMKVLCVIFLVLSFIVCMIATVFCAVHVIRLFTYAFCRRTHDGCVCFRSFDTESKFTDYSPVQSCEEVFCIVKYTIMASGFLCFVGSSAAFTFAASIFSARYGRIQSGS